MTALICQFSNRESVLIPMKTWFLDVSLLRYVNFSLYEHVVEDNGLLVSLRGRAVGVGLVLYDEFKKRYESASSLVDKTTQRLTNKPYTRGRDKAGFSFDKLVEIPVSQSSFVITLKLQMPLNPSFLLPDPNEVIDEVVYGMELLEEGLESQLKNHINNDPYYFHFVRIAKTMAPDGEDVEHVGLASARRSASLSRTRDNIVQLSPAQEATPESKEYVPIEVIGRLGFANIISDNAVGIALEDGTERKIKLTEGIDDIVVQFWNRNVKVTGVYDGEYIYASDILPERD